MTFFSKLTARIMQPKIGAAELSFYVIGKHPGWDDHMPDIGADNPEVLDFKQRFYVEALAGNINSGAWKHLPEPELLPEFNHRFVYWHADVVMHGAIWASRDGKGRTLFPLIGMVFSRGLNPRVIAAASSAVLDAFRASSLRQPTAEGLIAAVKVANDSLASLLPQTPMMDQLIPPLTGTQAGELLRLAGDDQHRARMIYALQRSVQHVKANAASRGDDFYETLRLPSVAGDAPVASGSHLPVDWPAWCLAHIGRRVPILAVAYEGRPDNRFTDVIIGAIKPTSIFPLRASREKIPLCSDIPFAMDSAFLNACEAYDKACMQVGDAPAPVLPIN